MKLIRADWIMLGALLLLLTAHVTTNFLIKYYEDAAETVGIAKEVVIQLEANPVARWFFALVGFKYIFSYAVAPGFLAGYYWYLRHKYINQVYTLEGYSIAFFVITLLAATNDLSLLMGVLL